MSGSFEQMSISEAKSKIVIYLNCPGSIQPGDCFFVKDEKGIRRVQVIPDPAKEVLR